MGNMQQTFIYVLLKAKAVGRDQVSQVDVSDKKQFQNSFRRHIVDFAKAKEEFKERQKERLGSQQNKKQSLRKGSPLQKQNEGWIAPFRRPKYEQLASQSSWRGHHK